MSKLDGWLLMAVIVLSGVIAGAWLGFIAGVAINVVRWMT